MGSVHSRTYIIYSTLQSTFLKWDHKLWMPLTAHQTWMTLHSTLWQEGTPHKEEVEMCRTAKDCEVTSDLNGGNNWRHLICVSARGCIHHFSNLGWEPDKCEILCFICSGKICLASLQFKQVSTQVSQSQHLSNMGRGWYVKLYKGATLRHVDQLYVTFCCFIDCSSIQLHPATF